MAANPPRGAMTAEDAHESLKINTWTSPVVDNSAATIGGLAAADYPCFHFPDYAIAIRAARLVYKTATSNTEGTIIIGTTADTDAIVTGGLTGDGSPVVAIGGVTELTLASTLKNPAVQKAFGYPIVPKATTVQMTPGAGSSNAGDYVVQIDYFRITPTKG